jgi:hypothetical protein
MNVNIVSLGLERLAMFNRPLVSERLTCKTLVGKVKGTIPGVTAIDVAVERSAKSSSAAICIPTVPAEIVSYGMGRPQTATLVGDMEW